MTATIQADLSILLMLPRHAGGTRSHNSGAEHSEPVVRHAASGDRASLVMLGMFVPVALRARVPLIDREVDVPSLHPKPAPG